MSTATQAFGFIGAADAYIDILTDAGEPTGLELKGNCKSFEPKPAADRKELISTGKHTYGQVLHSVVLPQPMTANIVFDQLDQDLFQAAFFGSTVAFNQAAGSISDQELTVAAGKWVEVGKMRLSAVEVTDKTGTTTFVEGEDYEVNAGLGMIKAIVGGDIEDGETIRVSADYAAVSGSTMSAMTKSNVRIRVKLDGKNMIDGREFVADIRSMRLNPTSSFSFVGTEFVECAFEGSLETPAGAAEPMTFVWLS